MKKSLFIPSLFYLVCLPTNALVDYSNPVGAGSSNSSASNQRNYVAEAPANFSEAYQNGSSQNSRSRSNYVVDVKAGYQTMDVSMDQRSGKVAKTQMGLFVQTPYDLYLEVDYFVASATSTSISPTKSGTQKGNPEAKIGFNWLSFGPSESAMNFDLVAGALIGQSNSDFATTRNETFLGIETSKRFSSLAFGLAYQYRFTGTPQASSNELQIGNIQKMSASLGWMVSPDIRFAVEGGRYTIDPSKKQSSSLAQLDEELVFSYISPTLSLNLSPKVMVNLGAVFRAERENGQKAYQARLWDKTGSYGNSLYASLGVNF